jgi:hypothetical protein
VDFPDSGVSLGKWSITELGEIVPLGNNLKNILEIEISDTGEKKEHLTFGEFMSDFEKNWVDRGDLAFVNLLCSEEDAEADIVSSKIF